MGKRRLSSDDESGNETETSSVTSGSAKKSRITSSLNSSGSVNCDSSVSMRKCCICGSMAAPTYTCVKCRRLFHENCNSFRVDEDGWGLCGGCLTSIILECPCCHQRGFKGIHGLRTHIGGYCQKRHSKDWRQHFKEFFVQLERRLAMIPNRSVTAFSIILNHMQVANAVSSSYSGEESASPPVKLVPDNYRPADMSLKDFVPAFCSVHGQIAQMNGPDNVKGGRSRNEERSFSHSATPAFSPQPLHRAESTDEVISNYNLRHKSSTQSNGSAYASPLASGPIMTPRGTSPVPLSPSPSMPPSSSASPAPMMTSIDKNSPQNAIMDCPFCEKSGYCGLSGIRTHIRNYCPAIDKSIWREKFTKCIKHNISKYEELNKAPEANTEFNNQVIAFLKAKATSDFKRNVVKSESRVPKDAAQPADVMNDIPYEEIYCKHCNDENDYCPFCGCTVCHYKHLGSQLLICDGCNKEYHTYCVSPPLKQIPEGKWFCPRCSEKQHRSSSKVYKDGIAALEDCEFTVGVKKAVQSLLHVPVSEDTSKETVDSVMHSLSVPELLQLQTYFLGFSNQLFNRIQSL